MAWYDEVDWVKEYPHGRYYFYEGNDPKGFVQEMKDKFNLDLSKDLEEFEQRSNEDFCLTFTCPPQHLHAMYANHYPLGT